MRDILSTLFTMLSLFFASVAVSYVLTAAIKKSKRVAAPKENAKARVRATNGVYRSRFLGETEEGWQFSAPLCRDAYVPFRVGEALIIEICGEEGLWRFRTEVVARDAQEHIFTMKRPAEIQTVERRGEERRTDFMGQTIEFEGQEVGILNVSEGGICVVSDQRLNPGDRVSMKLPWEMKPTFGYVLGREGSERFCRMRIRFDSPLLLPSAA